MRELHLMQLLEVEFLLVWGLLYDYLLLVIEILLYLNVGHVL